MNDDIKDQIKFLSFLFKRYEASRTALEKDPECSKSDDAPCVLLLPIFYKDVQRFSPSEESEFVSTDFYEICLLLKKAGVIEDISRIDIELWVSHIKGEQELPIHTIKIPLDFENKAHRYLELLKIAPDVKPTQVILFWNSTTKELSNWSGDTEVFSKRGQTENKQAIILDQCIVRKEVSFNKLANETGQSPELVRDSIRRINDKVVTKFNKTILSPINQSNSVVLIQENYYVVVL